MKVSKGAPCFIVGTEKVAIVCLTRLCRIFDDQLVAIWYFGGYLVWYMLLEFGLVFMLKNIAQPSSEVMDNTTLPPSLAMPSYSIVETEPREILGLYKSTMELI